MGRAYSQFKCVSAITFGVLFYLPVCSLHLSLALGMINSTKFVNNAKMAQSHQLVLSVWSHREFRGFNIRSGSVCGQYRQWMIPNYMSCLLYTFSYLCNCLLYIWAALPPWGLICSAAYRVNAL